MLLQSEQILEKVIFIVVKFSTSSHPARSKTLNFDPVTTRQHFINLLPLAVLLSNFSLQTIVSLILYRKTKLDIAYTSVSSPKSTLSRTAQVSDFRFYVL